MEMKQQIHRLHYKIKQAKWSFKLCGEFCWHCKRSGRGR